MTVAPLAIIQVRYGSTRLRGKALLPLADGRPILAHVYERACVAFGNQNVVIACPASDENFPIWSWAQQNYALLFVWDGEESDVLSRFWHCAHTHRWREDSVIVRLCCDDPFHDPSAMRRVAAGERLPVSLGGEAFTLEMLNLAERSIYADQTCREHITHALFDTAPPPNPPGAWTVDCEASYQAAVERSRVEMAHEHAKREFFGTAFAEERARRADERMRDMVAKSESMFHRRSDP